MADKRTGVDVHGGHCFGLIDDQITAGLQFNLALQRTLDLIFDIIEIEDWLTPGVMFQQAGISGMYSAVNSSSAS